MQWKAELTGSSEQRFQACQPVEVAQLNGSRIRGAIYPVRMDLIRLEIVINAVSVHNLFLLTAPWRVINFSVTADIDGQIVSLPFTGWPGADPEEATSQSEPFLIFFGSIRFIQLSEKWREEVSNLSEVWLQLLYFLVSGHGLTDRPMEIDPTSDQNKICQTARSVHRHAVRNSKSFRINMV